MHILLVDDVAVDRSIVRQGLVAVAEENVRYTIEEVESGAAALDRMRERDFDCILLHLRYPDIDGLALMQRLSEEHGDIAVPVVVLSSARDVSTAVEAMRLGARDYLVMDDEGNYLARLPAVMRRIRRAEELRQDKQRAEHALRAHRDLLEELLVARTTALKEANQRLQEDIRNREQVERALFKEQQRAEVTLQAISDAVVTLDANGRVEYVNPAAERLLLCANSEIKGKALLDYLPLMEEEGPAVSLQELIKGEEGSRYYRFNRRDEGEFIVEAKPAAIRDAQGGLVGLVVGLRDVTEERARTKQLSYQARHDALTGLVNRVEFEQRLARALENVDCQQHVLCFIDLDGFKEVNDTGGHAAGDEFLRQLSRKLSRQIRQRDTLARLGGDEFACLFEYCRLEQGLGLAAELLESVKNYTLVWKGRAFKVSASIGLVAVDQKATASIAEALQQADTALYAAKADGRGRIEVYTRGIQSDTATLRDHWRQRLTEALQHGGPLRLFQQPVTSLTSQNQQDYYEILLRFSADEGLVPAMDFMPTAERFRLTPSLDRWVIKHTIAHMGRHAPTAGQPTVNYFINISEASLREGGLPTLIEEQLIEHSVDPGRVIFEINEATVLALFQEALDFVHAVKAIGCRISLDDFANALSMVQQLRELQPDFVKIRGDLFEGLEQDPMAEELIEAIARISQTASIRTIAKWPRHQVALGALKALGVDYAQGHVIASPYPLGANAGVQVDYGLPL